MYAGGTPILVLKEGTDRKSGKGAQFNNIAAAKAIADAVRTTLGPKGMDKMLVDSMGDVVITNDGVTILKEVDVEHPAAKMVIEVAKTQDEQCGDGTTTAVIFAGELLKLAESLIEKNIHPTLITEGYRLASQKALEVLENVAMPIEEDEEALLKIAKTSMTGKSAGDMKEELAEIVVKAVRAIVEDRDGRKVADIDNIKVEKKQGGSIKDTELIEGIIVDKERVHEGMPTLVKNPKIALVNAAFEVKKTEVDAKIQITDPTQFQAFLENEENILREMADRIEKAGANVVFCQKGIDDLAQHFLAKKGIFAVRRVKKSDMEKLSKATGAKIISNLEDLAAEDLGEAGMVEEKKIGGDEMTFVTGCKNAKAVSVLIRGASEHVIDEIERGVHDALSTVAVAIEDGKMTAGGGAAAVEIARELRSFAINTGGREQFAIEAFATALEVVPRTLAENAGLDPISTIIDINKAHSDGKKYHGVNVYTGQIEDMRALSVLEPLRVGTQAIQAATETANMVLRIDDVIASKANSGGGGGAPGGMPPGGMGDMGGMGGMDY
ncbi:thermosome subunit [Thermoplasmatales archaeon ex4484_6]|nr:MAG: thermosome subunit [Thermoplasmatales archaeon ex4484_6]RLF69234.1 MAG: thermosome subunit [Thermoplasmata archaeon]